MMMEIPKSSHLKEILGMRVAFSNKHETSIDLERVISYPLAPMSILLSTPDGAIRETVQSKLIEMALADLAVLRPDHMPPPNQITFYFLDPVAYIRSSYSW